MPNKIKNYDLLSAYNYFTPDVTQFLALVMFFIGGVLISNGIGAVLLLAPGTGTDIIMLVSYPIMFIPAMIYASHQSQRNSMFDPGYNVDSSNFGRIGFAGIASMAMLATVALGYLTDIVNALMPEMSDRWKNMMEMMTGGNFILNFICVSVFAPFFEELLCRGLVLRGLLNFRRKKAAKDGKERGMNPVWAIIISSLFFAIIHMNPWQAVPAFILGCLFGYVYYRTGSLKTTMLMHFMNNTLALCLANIGPLKDAKTWFDIFSVPVYSVIAVIALAYLFLFIKSLDRIELKSPQGNCDYSEPLMP